MERGTRKQITFDLSDNNLKKYYPKPKISINPQYHKKAWGDIARFMKKNGFEHRQYSVYVSKDPLTRAKVNTLVNEMVAQMPWLNKCLNAIDVTDIGKQHSLMKAVEDAAIQLEKTMAEAKETKASDKEDKGMSMSDCKRMIAEERSKGDQSGKDKTPQKEKGKQSKDDRT